jgi:anti-anti-sigma regulatory factor
MNSINLSGDCTIYEISEIHQKVLQAWKKNKGLMLDLSEVTDADTSLIQLLLSCKQSARQQQQAFELRNVPQELTGKLEALYLDEWVLGTEEMALETSKASPAEGAE